MSVFHCLCFPGCSRLAQYWRDNSFINMSRRQATKTFGTQQLRIASKLDPNSSLSQQFKHTLEHLLQHRNSLLKLLQACSVWAQFRSNFSMFGFLILVFLPGLLNIGLKMCLSQFQTMFNRMFSQFTKLATSKAWKTCH